MDKVANEFCPNCHKLSLDIYYSENSDDRLGAQCDSCGLKGFFMGNKLVILATA